MQQPRSLAFEEIEPRGAQSLGNRASKGFVGKNWRWLLLVIVLAGGWFAEHLRNQKMLNGFYQIEVTISAVDAGSLRPLNPSVSSHHGPTTDNPWPQMATAAIDGNKLRLTISAIEPVEIEVGSDGYEPKMVQITRRSPFDLQVPLRRGQAP